METPEDKDNPFKATLEENGTEPTAQLSTPANGSTSRIVDVTEEGKSVIITGMAKCLEIRPLAFEENILVRIR